MNWNPIILGILEGFYTSYNGIFVPLGIVGFLLCWFHHKLAWLVVPVNLIVSGFFLVHFYKNFMSINWLSPTLIPLTVFCLLLSIIVPLVSTYYSWRTFKIKQQNLP